MLRMLPVLMQGNQDTRTLTEIVVMGKTYKRRSKLLEATALEIVVTDTGNTALKLEVPGCKDYVALRLNRHEVKKFKEALIACGNEPMVVTLPIQSQRQALLHYLS